MNVLDLFCCEGGAARGYHDAGHTVYGVDLDKGHEAGYLRSGAGFGSFGLDWAEGLARYGDQADFIHASPPCQSYSVMNNPSYTMHEAHKGEKSKQLRLIEPVYHALLATGKPFVIENVSGARRDLEALGGKGQVVTLMGDMFHLGAVLFPEDRPWSGEGKGRGAGQKSHEQHCQPAQRCAVQASISRARLFLFGNMVAPAPPPRDMAWKRSRQNVSIVNGCTTPDFHLLGHRDLSRAERAALLGMDWEMTKLGYAESLPPAYTRWIGGQLCSH